MEKELFFRLIFCSLYSFNFKSLCHENNSYLKLYIPPSTSCSIISIGCSPTLQLCWMISVFPGSDLVGGGAPILNGSQHPGSAGRSELATRESLVLQGQKSPWTTSYFLIILLSSQNIPEMFFLILLPQAPASLFVILSIISTPCICSSPDYCPRGGPDLFWSSPYWTTRCWKLDLDPMSFDYQLRWFGGRG